MLLSMRTCQCFGHHFSPLGGLDWLLLWSLHLMGCCGSVCFCCFDCSKEIEPCGAKWWTWGAALISAGRILAASIIVVRTMIVGFWRGGVKGRSFGLSLDRCWGDTYSLRQWTTAYIAPKNWCHFAYSRFAYSQFAYLLPLGAISPTEAKCDKNNMKWLKQAVQVYEVKGIVQKRN